jgi:N-acetylglucosamine kinase-like BadF-type ATPase
MVLFLGIDGGGSRTQACLGDERGRILAKAVAGPSNPLKVGIERAKKELLRAARAVLRSVSTGAGDEPPLVRAARERRHHKPLLVAVCAGVAGVDRPAVSRPLLAWLRTAIPARHHLLVTDTAIALEAALGTAAGIIVVSGTGSIAYARNRRGETLRAGGWGAAFDDPGSGYDLGRKAIMAALRDFDGRGERTVLTSRICRALKISDIAQIVLKKLEIQQVAGLFPLVAEAARQGDRVARRLCTQAAFDLAQLALTVAPRLGRRGMLPVVCVGGVFRSCPILRRSFARYLHQRLPSARVRLLQREPVEGALAMARKLAASSAPVSFRVCMGLRPTHGNESQAVVTPAQAGVHLDSRFRGNDVTFERAKRGISP